jgi:hypothetical protein
MNAPLRKSFVSLPSTPHAPAHPQRPKYGWLLKTLVNNSLIFYIVPEIK